MRKTIEIVTQVNSLPKQGATMEDVASIVEYLSTDYGETARLATKYKLIIMAKAMEPSEKERTIQYLMETLCTAADSYQQRNLFEIVHSVGSSALRPKLRNILNDCHIHTLVRMRCLMALGALA